MSFRFRDRAQAGRFLADKLESCAGEPAAVVLGLPRGGVPVAAEIANHLGARLDIFLVRKVGAPGQAELALGAIASGGVIILNHAVIADLRVSPRELETLIARAQTELRALENHYRPADHAANLRGRLIILVDDGLATGATMRAAVAAVRERQPARIVVAVPVAARDVVEQFRTAADEFVCVQTPPDFRGVGQFYEDFSQTSDEEVRRLLARAIQPRQPIPAASGASSFGF